MIRVLGIVLLFAGCTAPAVPPQVDRLGLGAMVSEVDAGRHGAIAAITISQGGAIVFDDTYGTVQPGTRIDMRSVGKSITALALGAAIADGDLPGLDARALPYFQDRLPPRNDHPAKRAMTVGDLAAMRGPLDCNDWRATPGTEELMYPTPEWTEFVLALPVDPRRDGPDGTGRFAYCTAGVFLLGQVIERAVGTRFDAYVQARLFDLIGVSGATWWGSTSGEVQAGGQLHLTAADAERLGRLVLQRGHWEGRRVLPRAWIDRMVRPISELPFGTGFGLLWWTMDLPVRDRRVQVEMMVGNGGNIVAVVPELDAVAVIQSQAYRDPNARAASLLLLSDHVLPALMARTPKKGRT